MHEHDLDLIAAYADGTADRDQATAAADLIRACQVCHEEHDAQMVALQALAEVQPARMTDLERARLHRAVLTAVGAAETAPVQVADRRRARWVAWLPRVAVAAVAAAFVGFIGFGLVGGNADDAGSDGADPVAAEAASDITAATDTIAQSPTTAAAAAAPSDDTATAMAAEPVEESLAAADAAAPQDVRRSLGSIDVTTLDEFTRQGPDAFAYGEPEAEGVDYRCQARIAGLAGSPDAVVQVIGHGTYRGASVEVYATGGAVFVLDERTCQLVATRSA